jgi:hypothetical protein
MIRRFSLLALVSVLLPVGLASAQESFPIMEQVAQKVIEKYQTSSCQQLGPCTSSVRVNTRGMPGNLSQEQKDLAERPRRASQWPSHPV